MHKKLIAHLLLVFLLTSCGQEYWDFHDGKKKLSDRKEQVVEAAQTFSVDQLESRELEIFSTPDPVVLDRIVGMIDRAQSRVQVEVYILTEKRIIEAMEKAKRRWVRVQAILEKNVFGGTGVNAKTFALLKEAGVGVAYASNKLYVYTHAKTILVDDVYIITTGNFSHASFTSNREFYVIGKNKKDMETLEELFAADFIGKEVITSSPNLVISPIDSRSKIEGILSASKKSIFLYAENFDDPAIISILSEKAAQGIPVTVCMADPKKVSSNTQALALLKSRGIDARSAKKPVIHAKVALVDDIYDYIGSENFTTNSLDNNREIGMMMRSSSGFVDMFRKSFQHDCPASLR